MTKVNSELSIIIATFNVEATLERCLKSVVSQSFKDYELILIDGASSDGTLEIIERYKGYCKYTESDRDGGIYSAWNKALKRAHGKWVMFLGADDYLVHENILSELMHFAKSSGVDLVTVRNVGVDACGRETEVYGEAWVWDRFKRYMNICHVGALHCREMLDKYGPFDEEYKIAGDYEFLMRAGADLKVADFSQVVACCGNDGVSRKRVVKAFKEAIRLQRKHRSSSLVRSLLRYSLSYLKISVKEFLK